MMRVYIPTRGRPSEQPAYHQLEAAGLGPTLVVDNDEAHLYREYRSIAIPRGSIAFKRQFILEHAAGAKFAQVDDDVVFHRVSFTGSQCRILTPEPGDLRYDFAQAESDLSAWAHGGIHQRSFVNSAPRQMALNRGYYRQVIFMNPELVRSHGKQMPRYEGHGSEDLKFMVKLLEMGFDYFILTSCCISEKRSKELPSHFTQEQKDADLAETWARHAHHTKNLKNGRKTLSFSGILKEAKSKR